MGDQVRSVGERLEGLFAGWIEALVGAVPKVLVAAVLLIVAVVVARLVRRLLAVTLTRLKIDALLSKAGLDGALNRIGISRLSEVLPRLVYGLLLFVFVGIGAEAVGLDAVARAIGSVLAYLPNVAAALLLLVFGSWAAQAAGKAVARAAEGSGLEFGPSLGRVISAMVFFVVALTAASQLKIDTDVVRIFTLCALAGLALAFGLAVGLGSREILRNILSGFYARKLFRAGDQIRVDAVEGTLVGISSTQTLIEQGDETVALPNTVFLEGAVSLKGRLADQIEAE